MSTVRSISEKKIEANRRNAQQSTGPKTEAGKHASRINAVTHGLLAQAIVITAGDYQEDPQAFAQLLEGLREQFTPEGVAEDLEVQQIALYYWRKMRAARYEHGAIRKRTGDLREREKLGREKDFNRDLHYESSLEGSSRGIQWLIESLEVTREEVLDGTLSPESQEGLERHFPGEFPPPDETEVGREGERRMTTEDYERRMVAKIDEHLRRLAPMREKAAAIEEVNLDSKIRAAALPTSAAVDKLIRYETSNDRALDRALKRLEGLQACRRKAGEATAEK